MSEHPVAGELWECRKTHRAVVIEDVAGGWVHAQPAGLGARISMFPAAFLRDWKRADDRYQPERLISDRPPHFADPSCRCDGPRCGSRFSGLAETADRRTT